MWLLATNLGINIISRWVVLAAHILIDQKWKNVFGKVLKM